MLAFPLTGVILMLPSLIIVLFADLAVPTLSPLSILNVIVCYIDPNVQIESQWPTERRQLACTISLA